MVKQLKTNYIRETECQLFNVDISLNILNPNSRAFETKKCIIQIKSLKLGYSNSNKT